LLKRDISATEFHRLQDDLKEFMELYPTDKILEIALDYLAYDEEVRKFVVYIQSEEFPKIHKIVEHLKEYEYVSAFMCMVFMHQSDREKFVHFQLGV
jgi:nitrate reductase NapAB chaperone NapD